MTVDLTFSQRKGYISLPEPLQLEHLSQPLRVELWNLIYEFILPFMNRTLVMSGGPGSGSIYFERSMKKCFQETYSRMYTVPLDDARLDDDHNLYEGSKSTVLCGDFHEVFEWIEVFSALAVKHIAPGDMPCGQDSKHGTQLAVRVQNAMEQYAAAYHFTSDEWPFPPYRFEPHASQRSADLTLNALQSIKKADLQGVTSQLDQAAQHISNARWAEAVRDSIHAVESIVQEITSEHSLAKGLKNLESRGVQIHSALKDAFIKLYGYTNNEPGIRHALDATKEGASVGMPEALFMYTSCTAFVDYLLQQREQTR